ncbi:MAG: hypothetical protein JO030_04085, partial [Candidatus Eremiobacteraeota bacterium]|nr:hypothetical protein [Candidatus Eremiobacteraeota bacterium]
MTDFRRPEGILLYYDPAPEVSTLPTVTSKRSQAAERRVPRPTSFIFTLYGDVVARAGGDGWLRIGALIEIMDAFGVSPAAVRQAVSRMSRQGWLRGRRLRNRAYYAVTARGRRRIQEL